MIRQFLVSPLLVICISLCPKRYLILSLQSTFDTEYMVDGLQPFTEYEIELSVSNMYTIRRSYLDPLFSTGTRFKTREGGIVEQYFVSMY